MTLYESKIDSYYKQKRKLTYQKIRKIFNDTYNTIVSKRSIGHLYRENCNCPDIAASINPNEYSVVLAHASNSVCEMGKLHWWESERLLERLYDGSVIVGFSEKNKKIILMYLGGHNTVVGVWSFSLGNCDLKMKFTKSEKTHLSYECRFFSPIFNSSTLPIIETENKWIFTHDKNQDILGFKSLFFEGIIFDNDPMLSDNKELMVFLERNIGQIERV